jgi:transposase InsO family protein
MAIRRSRTTHTQPGGTKGKAKNRQHNPKMGYAFVHTVIDYHSRVAYAEVHDDQTAATAVAVLGRAVTWFASRGVTVGRVLSDNGAASVSHLWRDTCTELRIKHSRTRSHAHRPTGGSRGSTAPSQTVGDSARCYLSEGERRAALSAWLHTYNHHRPHTAIGNKPPVTRLINLPGRYA